MEENFVNQVKYVDHRILIFSKENYLTMANYIMVQWLVMHKFVIHLIHLIIILIMTKQVILNYPKRGVKSNLKQPNDKRLFSPFIIFSHLQWG